MASWATVTTLLEPIETVKRFVAHHLGLGASQIFLYFDNPEDPAAEVVAQIPGVIVRKRREGASEVHEKRQRANANEAYHATTADWLIHIDADEFVSADMDVGEQLAAFEQDSVRLVPFESLYEPRERLRRQGQFFRGPLGKSARERRIAELAYGPFEQVLNAGMLSHASGKFFVRTRVEGMVMAIHAPRSRQELIEHGTAEKMRLLHFHGGDYPSWRAHLERRLNTGAYLVIHQKRLMRQKGVESTLYGVLSALRDAEGEAGLERFYQQVCTISPEKKRLSKVGALHYENLNLPQKVEQMFDRERREN